MRKLVQSLLRGMKVTKEMNIDLRGLCWLSFVHAVMKFHFYGWFLLKLLLSLYVHFHVFFVETTC